MTGGTDTAWALLVSSRYFPLVGAPALVGRAEVGRDSDGVTAVVIGERFWRTRLGAAPLAGLTLQLNDVTTRVAGVVPESFTGPAGLYSPDVWLPLEDLAIFRMSPALEHRDERWLFLFGRLAPGVSAAEMQARVEAAAAAMARDWPATHSRRRARFRPFSEVEGELRVARAAGVVAMGVIGLVLLLACFNVANLLVARAVERERDIAIRAAVGASRWRLLRLMVSEGFVLAILAGAAALALAASTRVLLGAFAIPIEQPQHLDFTLDARVVGFILLLVAIAGVIPGLWPARAASSVDVGRVLASSAGNSATRATSRARQGLVGAQIAGSTAFLVVAALFVQSYGTLADVDVGFDRDRLVVIEVAPAVHGYDAERSTRYLDQLTGRVRALPGVERVAIAEQAPFFIGFDRRTAASSAARPCEPEACASYRTVAVGPGYFETLGIDLVGGRPFAIGESAAVIVNEPFVERLWPDGGGLGETLRLGERGVPAVVVGITERTQSRGLDREEPMIYVPLDDEQLAGSVAVIVRSSAAPESLVRAVTDAAQAVDPRVATLSVKTMGARMAVQLWPFRTVSWLFSICGALALLLATVGLAGVVAHGVKRRVKEFGVRVSMGASPRDLVRDVLGDSVRLLVPGLLVGALLGAGGARLGRAAFVGVDVLDPLAYVAVAAFEIAVVLVACAGPALAAARVDPVVALRE